MNFTKGTLTVALTALLTACGGGSDSYYNNSNAGVNTQPPAGQNPPTTAAEAQILMNQFQKLKIFSSIAVVYLKKK